MSDEDKGQEEEQKSLRNAFIIYAVVEALILIPLVVYLIFR
jgi:hypothetical protein